MADRVTLIDPPSPFAPLDEWRAYLAELRLGQDEEPSDDLAQAIADAEQHIAANE